MKAWDILGYAYDADLHCEHCTRERFPSADAEFSDVTDSEGNEIHPIFASDEMSSEGEYCGDCGREICEPFDRGEDSEDSDSEEEPEYEPEEEDIFTEDYRHFYYRHKLIVTADDAADDWMPAVGAWCKAQGYFPNVWFVSDHGNAHLISVTDDGRYLGGHSDD